VLTFLGVTFSAVGTVIVVGAHWIYRNSETILTAINSNPRAARTEIVAADVGAEIFGNGFYEGRNDGANVSTVASDIAPAFANGRLASGLEMMVAAPGANYDRPDPSSM
jgi:urate oxidase